MSDQHPPSEGPDDADSGGTPDFLAKPVSPSEGQQPQAWPGYAASDQPSPEEPAGPGGQEFHEYAQTPPSSPPPPQAGYPGYAPAYGYGYYGQAHTGANTAMGLGITSLVSAVLVPMCCVTIVAVPTGPFAIWMALRARKDMADHPGAYNNQGAATAGLVCGIIGTVLGVLMVVGTFLLFGFVFAVGDY